MKTISMSSCVMIAVLAVGLVTGEPALGVSLLPGWPKTTGQYVESSPALGDLDGDGHLEVVVGSDDFKVYAWHHDGTPVAGWPQTTGDVVGSSAAVGDLDGDGKLEVVVGSYDGKVYAWHRDGTALAGWPQTTGGPIYHGSPALGDLDGDGKLEVVVGSTDGKVYAWHHDGTLVVGWPQTTGGPIGSNSPALGDLDGDGKREVVVGSGDFKVYAWHHDGTPVAGWPQTTGRYVESSPALGDLDGDGSLEVVVGSDDAKVYAWHHDGTPLAGWPQRAGNGFRSSPALGDLDGDGYLEVVVGSDYGFDGRVYAWHHDGTPVAGWPQTTGDWVESSPALGDLDGDGSLEVVVGSWDHKVYAWTCDTPTYDLLPWPMFRHDVLHTGRYGQTEPDAISGQVRVRGTSTNIVGATVEARIGGVLKGSGTTAANGVYSITDLPPGPYAVSAAMDGYVTQVKSGISVTTGATTYVNFGLVASGTLMGQVTQRGTSTSLVGATVNAYVGSVLTATATTGSYGVYRINRDLPTGNYVVIASQTGHVPQTKAPVTVTAGATTYVNFFLNRISLMGQVRQAGTTTNLAGATVEAYLGSATTPSGTGTTDANGIYQIGGLATGSYTVIASESGYVKQTKPGIAFTAGAITYVNFNLQVSGKLMGQVTNKVTGAPVIGATVSPRTGGVVQATGTTVGPYGVYQITSDLPPGTYTMLCTATGFQDFGRIGIVVTAGATTYVNFPLQPR